MERSQELAGSVLVIDDELGRIFQEFYRSEAAKAQAELGMGLPIANQIVKLYQGAIEVDSARGQGTTFSAKLPSVSTGEVA